MSQSPTWWRILVLATVVLCIAFAVGATGQGSKTTGTFATVDFPKIAKEFKGSQLFESDMVALKKKFDERLARRSTFFLLTDDELKQLDDLYEKGTAQTDGDRQKIKDIETKGNGLLKQYTDLTQKKDLSDAETKQLTEWAKQRSNAQEAFASLQDNLTTQFRDTQTKKNDELMTQVKATIAKLAEQKGIVIVFSSDTALYAGTDLTTAVIAELNKGK